MYRRMNVFLKGAAMDGPVVTGAEMIRVIDEHGGMHWCLGGIVRFLRPPGDASQLQIGTPLIRISASLGKAPSHYKVASPLFFQRGNWAVILEPDAARNSTEVPGLKQHNACCRAVHVHLICQTHLGKVFKPSMGVRFLLSS